MKDAQSIILAYNKGLPPDRQAEKYAALQESLLRFYRGTCHLFYDRLESIGFPKDKTKAWICGDLHLENFGSFKADNRLVYFDVNDFDEAVLAPVSWEVLRFITAILLSGDFIKYSDKEAALIAKAALQKYTDAIISGKALIMQREMSTGLMKKFFEQAAMRKREDLIDRVSEMAGKKRILRPDDIHIRKLDEHLHKKLMDWLREGIDEIGKLKNLKVEDCAGRIAGTGSLGVDRYVILAKQRTTGKYYLLDMKKAKPSSLVKHLKVKQPGWKSEAARIIATQSRMQFYPPALLSSARFNKKDFVIKELQPVQDKMDFKLAAGNLDHMQDVIMSMAEISAYTHLRSSGRQASSTADELKELVSKPKWQTDILDIAHELASQIRADYADFSKYKLSQRV